MDCFESKYELGKERYHENRGCEREERDERRTIEGIPLNVC